MFKGGRDPARTPYRRNSHRAHPPGKTRTSFKPLLIRRRNGEMRCERPNASYLYPNDAAVEARSNRSQSVKFPADGRDDRALSRTVSSQFNQSPLRPYNFSRLRRNLCQSKAANDVSLWTDWGVEELLGAHVGPLGNVCICPDNGLRRSPAMYLHGSSLLKTLGASAVDHFEHSSLPPIRGSGPVSAHEGPEKREVSQ
jgi:hypothetical protein